MVRTVLIGLVFCLALSACATQRLAIDNAGSDRLVLVKGMDEDAHGRPVPGKRLHERPTKVGKRYTAVLMRSGLPLRSYDINITHPPKPDFLRPVEILGTYTLKGIVGGLGVSYFMLLADDGGEDDTEMSDEEFELRLELAAASVVVGTAVGLVVGLVKGTPVMAEQVHLLVLDSREFLVGYTLYEYDAFGRLCEVKRYIPGGRYTRVVSQEFMYEGEGDVPSSIATFNDIVPTSEVSGI